MPQNRQNLKFQSDGAFFGHVNVEQSGTEVYCALCVYLGESKKPLNWDELKPVVFASPFVRENGQNLRILTYSGRK